MSERATIFQGVQVGVETTPGMGVAANKKLGALSISPAVKAEVNKFRPMGTKFPTLAALGKEWVEAGLSGQPTYSEIIYVLSSVLGVDTPTLLGTLAYEWVFAPSSTTADTVKTFTVEQGDATRAHKFVYGLVKSLQVNFSRGENTLEGSMLGRALTDGVTLTASPTAIELVPVLPTQVSVYLEDAQTDLDTADALERVLSVGWGISDRFGPLWALNRDNASWVTHVEQEPGLECTLKMEADAEGMGLLGTMRTGDTKFLRIEALGVEIETGYNYLLQIDTAVKVTDVSEFSDEDGVFAVEWSFSGVHDATWGKATEVTVVNKLAVL